MLPDKSIPTRVLLLLYVPTLHQCQLGLAAYVS